MEVTLPYTSKNTLLDVLKDFIPVDIKEFTGKIVIPIKKPEEIGVIQYTGYVKVKYKNNRG